MLELLVTDAMSLRCAHNDFSVYLGSVLNSTSQSSRVTRSYLFTKKCNVCDSMSHTEDLSRSFSLNTTLPRGKVWPITEDVQRILK